MRFDLIARAGGLSQAHGAAQHRDLLGLARQDAPLAVAVLVVGLLTLGFSMVWLVSGLGTKFELYQLHKSLGVLVLTLVLVRLAWRWLNPRVPASAGGSGALGTRGGELTHRGFYVLLLLLPITGWIVASASPLGMPTVVFGLFTLPNPVGPNAALEHAMTWVHGGLALLSRCCCRCTSARR